MLYDNNMREENKHLTISIEGKLLYPPGEQNQDTVQEKTNKEFILLNQIVLYPPKFIYLLEVMKNEYHDIEFDINELARRTHTRMNLICELYRDNAGITPSVCLENFRIGNSLVNLSLLEFDIKFIARNAGFARQQKFSRTIFRRFHLAVEELRQKIILSPDIHTFLEDKNEYLWKDAKIFFPLEIQNAPKRYNLPQNDKRCRL